MKVIGILVANGVTQWCLQHLGLLFAGVWKWCHPRMLAVYLGLLFIWNIIGATRGREDKTSHLKLCLSPLASAGSSLPWTFAMWESFAVDLRVVDGFLAHLIGLFPPPIITVHLAYTFGWSGCETSISLTHLEYKQKMVSPKNACCT